MSAVGSETQSDGLQHVSAAVDPSDGVKRKHARVHPVCAHSTHTSDAQILLVVLVIRDILLVRITCTSMLVTSYDTRNNDTFAFPRLQKQSQHSFAKSAKRMQFCGKIEYELFSEIHS